MLLSKIPALSNNIVDKQYKLANFYEQFSGIFDSDDEFVINGESGDDNVIRLYKHDEYSFKNYVNLCHSCKSNKVVSNGNYERMISFLTISTYKCLVQVYKCKKCGKTFVADLSSFIKPNSNITNRVRATIKHYHAVHGSTLRQIKYSLKEEHNVDISHQTIQNFLLEDDLSFNADNWRFFWILLV